MVLHRDGHTHIFHDDGLTPLKNLARKHKEQKFRAAVEADGSVYKYPVAETFDVVVTNPPFSITLDESVKTHLGEDFALAEDRNSENLFLERWYQLLKPNGRLAAVLPESFFSTAENLSARLFLFRHFHVRAVVTLPSHAFQPWTPTRTSLLFAQKKTREEESTWGETFDQRLMETCAAQRAVLDAARKIVKPGKRTTTEQLEAHAKAASDGLVGLGLEAHEGVVTSPEWATRAASLAKSVSPEELAFAATVVSAPVDPYIGLIVEEVGFRRTKRAENSAPNDLFRATQASASGGEEVIRNLNDAKDGWKTVVTEGARDALSMLREEPLWR